MSRHYSLCEKLWKNREKIRQVCENQIMGSGVSYMWKRY